MNKIKLLALFGESSAGKDTIQHWLTSEIPNMHGLVSYTTRPPRDYEVDGKDYHFINKQEFRRLIIEKKILECTIFNWWYYGTSIDELKKDKINVGVFNPDGIYQLLRSSQDKDIDILPVWIQVSEKIRLLRSLYREIDPNCTEICRRFLADQDDFSRIDFDYEIYLNNNNNGNYYGILKRPKVETFIKGE
jgi:guanylate kinase